jgi:hypothetical protein
MRLVKSVLVVAIAAFIATHSTPAFATFHLMQIEQVIVGVNGDQTAQAVQLRMRAGLENNVAAARLRVLNAAGGVPVTLIDFASAVPNDGAGRRILIATPSFTTSPPVTPDFVMVQIPSSYFAAGSLIYEQDPPGPLVLWRLSWGGAGYTGIGTGTTDNDLNGQFNPPYGGALPSSGNGQALRFTGTATALSTTNAADYALTPPGPGATFTNNANESGTVPVPVPAENSTWGRVKSSYR